MASVIVRLSDNIVVDASDKDDLNWDARFYDNLHPVINPIAPGDRPGFYFRDTDDVIKLRPKADIEREFAGELLKIQKTDWATAIALVPDGPEKDALNILAKRGGLV